MTGWLLDAMRGTILKGIYILESSVLEEKNLSTLLTYVVDSLFIGDRLAHGL